MRSWSVWLCVCLLLGFSTGCTAAAQRPRSAPVLRQAQRDPPQPQRPGRGSPGPLPQPLHAPPPAYGNKIVLWEGGSLHVRGHANPGDTASIVANNGPNP